MARVACTFSVCKRYDTRHPPSLISISELQLTTFELWTYTRARVVQVQPPKPPPFGCNAPCHRRRAWLNNHLLFLLSLSLSCCIALSLFLSHNKWPAWRICSRESCSARSAIGSLRARVVSCGKIRVACPPVCQFACVAERGWKSIASRSDLFIPKYASTAAATCLIRAARRPSLWVTVKSREIYCLCVCNSLSCYCCLRWIVNRRHLKNSVEKKLSFVLFKSLWNAKCKQRSSESAMTSFFSVLQCRLNNMCSYVSGTFDMN